MRVLLLCAICAVSTIQCRKIYDVEAESIKLYGEDLNSVLLRFRKSPEYLSILKDKFEERKANLLIIIANVMHYYKNILKEKVVELLVPKNETAKHLRNLRSNFNGDARDPLRFLRQASTGAPSGNPLDLYIRKKQSLSAEKSNMVKDLAFEYVGYAIHTIIKHMGPEDTPGKSTQLPYGGDQVESKMPATTEHREHMVTSTTSEAAGVTEASDPVEAFRYTYKYRAASGITK